MPDLDPLAYLQLTGLGVTRLAAVAGFVRIVVVRPGIKRCMLNKKVKDLKVLA